MTAPVVVQGLPKPRALLEQRAAIEVPPVHPGVNNARVTVVVAQDHAKLCALLATRLCHVADRARRAFLCSVELARLDEVSSAADLHGTVIARPHPNLRSDSLSDDERPPKPIAHDDRSCSRRLIFQYAEIGRKRPGAQPAGSLVHPRPYVQPG